MVEDNQNFNYNDIIFRSDDSDDEKIINNDSKRNTINIKKIFDMINNIVTSDDYFSEIKIEIEITDLKIYEKIIFLKMRDNTASINGIIYKNKYKSDILVGSKYIVYCSLTIYYGNIQLVITEYINIGCGEHSIEIEKIKQKLKKIGYMDEKPIIKDNYTFVGIITSLNAAGLKDFLHIVNQRCLGKSIYIYPSIVQGENADKQISNAIQIANEHGKSQLIALIRGGGSKEDLECFNSEFLAKKIYESKIPIVTGIGHENDISVSDLVSAKSFITPSAVAQNIFKNDREYISLAQKIIKNIGNKILNFLNNRFVYLEEIGKLLGDLSNKIIKKIEKYHEKHLSNIKCIKKNIMKKIDLNFEYIKNINLDLYLATITVNTNNNMISYDELEKKIEKLKNKLSENLSVYKKTINNYGNDIKIISSPKIFDAKNNLVEFMDKIKKGGEYKIHFIDGIYNLKF